MNTKVQSALELRVTDLENTIKDLEDQIANMPKARDRGPSSTKTMSDDDAQKVCYGEHKDLSHKSAALKLGLSYAQVYSARGQYTFKHVHKANSSK